MKDKRAAGKFPRRTPIHKARPDALLWSQDMLGLCARITVVGNARVLVENHTGLLELTDTRIKLNTGCGPVAVAGEGLRLCDARPRAAIVSGRIHFIDLPREGGDCAP
ncbi:MAG: YabP/YqfC family sporulation protein [Clostridia bacterium]|nr:YabP/YqfC family sporulation protein [Clostridia bacterium]